MPPSLYMGKIDIRLISDLAFLVGSGISMYYICRMIFAQDHNSGLSEDQKRKVLTAADRLDPAIVNDMSEYEIRLLANVVLPEEIKSGFDEIGGLENIVDDLREAVIFPLTHSEQLQSTPLLQAPKGVLLYGPPGCGKTMLAKALARESGANFINIQLSTLMDKWYGESNKIVAGLFSLAYKLSPCIIFIDEIDSFMRERSSTDHEASATMKAEFMTRWDGLSTSSSGGVLILGATNRPFDIDDAIMRRMPKRFAVNKPGPVQRRKILEILLKDTPTDKNLDWDALVEATAGQSGSDIREYCREAAMNAMKELYRKHFKGPGKTMEGTEKPRLRPLVTSDFIRDLLD